MNRPEHNQLWNKIQQFVLDEPTATITFSKKLADQQKWPASYTERVIDEYRKFIFLCCISPKGASPSSAVDEAWHLHLTYTQSYWNAFCKNTLGKEIHHHPSGGGQQENHRHINWYNDTLKLYESVFGNQPPADIWPPPLKQLQPAKLSWPVSEEPYHITKELLIVVALLLLLPFVINYFISGKYSPFSLKGPQFLLFYAMLGVAAIIAHYILWKSRQLYVKRLVNAWTISDVNIFQLTHAVYGKEHALQTSLVDLYRRRLVSVDENGKIVVHSNSYQEPQKEENPLIPPLMQKEDGSTVDYDTIAGDWYQIKSFQHSAIDELYRLTDVKQSWFQKNILLLFALLIGFARIMQGWINDKPVVLLFLEIIALAITIGAMNMFLSTDDLPYHKIKEQLLDKAGSNQLYEDEVINDYAANGAQVIDRLPASLMLGTMFATFPVAAPLARSERKDRDKSSGDDSGSSCGSSDISCGSSDTSSGSDSSCGGGGCGGCGGGSD